MPSDDCEGAKHQYIMLFIMVSSLAMCQAGSEIVGLIAAACKTAEDAFGVMLVTIPKSYVSEI